MEEDVRMRYKVIINDEERLANGDETEFSDVCYEVGELLRSGYFEVESVEELPWELDDGTS